MTKHVFNSDSRLIGIFGEKFFWNFFFWKLFFLMNEIFKPSPFEENNIKYCQTKKNWSIIMKILISRSILSTKLVLISFWSQFMHPYVLYIDNYCYISTQSYFKDFSRFSYTQYLWFHKLWIIETWKTAKTANVAVLGDFKAVFGLFW